MRVNGSCLVGCVQSKPQPSYHRFPVDRTCWSAANAPSCRRGAAARPAGVARSCTNRKGRLGDHTDWAWSWCATVRPHGLPTPDVTIWSTRPAPLGYVLGILRDLSDDATILGVADAVGSTVTLELLAALTEADSLATGPSAWGSWKAGLVKELVERVDHVLGGGAVQELAGNEFPTIEQRQLLTRGDLYVEGMGDTLIVVAPDRPGLFSRITGAVALHGLDVLAADAVSENGTALDRLRVEHSLGLEIDWSRVTENVRLAAQGRLAVEARLAARASSQAHRYRPTGSRPTVTFDDEASTRPPSSRSTRRPGRPALPDPRTFADLDLDISTAKVQTARGPVVDCFYVTARRRRITDPAHRTRSPAPSSIR